MHLDREDKLWKEMLTHCDSEVPNENPIGCFNGTDNTQSQLYHHLDNCIWLVNEKIMNDSFWFACFSNYYQFLKIFHAVTTTTFLKHVVL